MAWETDDTNVVSEVLTTELRTEADLVRLLENELLKLYITECAACLVTCRRELVIELGRSKLNCEEVLLS